MLNRSVPQSLSVNHLVVPSRLAFVFGLFFGLGLGLLFMLRRTLYDLYGQYFFPEVMVKFMRWATGHFVMLIETGMHLIMITCTSGHKITVVENREFKQQQRLQLSQKTSLKNKHLRKHDYFVIIAHCKTLHLEISRPTHRLAD